MKLTKVLKQCWRGCQKMPHVGEHPGTALCIGLVIITGLAGAQKGGVLGFIIAAIAAGIIYGPMYFYGAYSRAQLSDNLCQKRIDAGRAAIERSEG